MSDTSGVQSPEFPFRWTQDERGAVTIHDVICVGEHATPRFVIVTAPAPEDEDA